ncbi:heavy metal-responsive transcriptional regulator [Thermomonas sp. HDW16]|uniref:heavy metal-responsive transcriptional regulator n=1 Tax=Thermomonas sp. HDW16 TaxID=2714945 RepID=UPI0014074ECF|nr:heavy metal-responsive transcriptional regulator [Thermomonas sp. HDW16]QIL20627.1 heavy metal-responsive transcriptional regulator [Thermomonas sp. HDW16]
MQIGQLAQHTGVAIDTVRYYERQGLLPPPQRRASGYRQYGEQDISRLRFIRRAKDLGFSLQEIQDLLRLSASEDADRAEVRALAQHRLADIEHKMRNLEAMRATLANLVSHCSGHGSLDNCPIIESLLGVELKP